jgi:hypothetical protein
VSLSCAQTGKADLVVRDDGETIAEIRSLRMTRACFRPGGESFLGPEVPLPLYWMQYANHEDPERNAGSGAELHLVASDPEKVVVRCEGSTASGAALSTFLIRIVRTPAPVRYLYRISAKLEVVSSAGWTVTGNPSHGEVEFANFWPRDTFTTREGGRKLYQACYLIRSNEVNRIPHHHLESPDKHRITMEPGDRFLWGVEEENPCLTMESGGKVSAGLCAYMWDAHFAFDATGGKPSVTLRAGEVFNSTYTLSVLDRQETVGLIGGAHEIPTPDREPIYVDGVNRFSERIDTPGIDPGNAWPWETEGDAEFSRDSARGYDDGFSLRISRSVPGRALWKATALGPAFGKPAWNAGVRFRFHALVMAEDFSGTVSVGIRLHREGEGSLLDPRDYELFTSGKGGDGLAPWTRLDVMTPPVSPPPDRLHLLLVADGKGTVWFDNAHLEVL